MNTTETPSGGSLDAVVSQRWMCRLCGRDKFTKPGQPHRCQGGFRKRFKKAARLNGWDNCWVKLANDPVSNSRREGLAMQTDALPAVCSNGLFA